LASRLAGRVDQLECRSIRSDPRPFRWVPTDQLIAGRELLRFALNDKWTGELSRQLIEQAPTIAQHMKDKLPGLAKVLASQDGPKTEDPNPKGRKR